MVTEGGLGERPQETPRVTKVGANMGIAGANTNCAAPSFSGSSSSSTASGGDVGTAGAVLMRHPCILEEHPLLPPGEIGPGVEGRVVVPSTDRAPCLLASAVLPSMAEGEASEAHDDAAVGRSSGASAPSGGLATGAALSRGRRAPLEEGRGTVLVAATAAAAATPCPPHVRARAGRGGRAAPTSQGGGGRCRVRAATLGF